MHLKPIKKKIYAFKDQMHHQPEMVKTNENICLHLFTLNICLQSLKHDGS